MLPALGKLVAGPLSGWLLATYTPMVGNEVGDVTNHTMVWVWIGGMAVLSPIGLVIFRKMFTVAEKKRQDSIAGGDEDAAAD